MFTFNRFLGIGLLFALPFLVLNALIVGQTESVLNFLRPDGHTSLVEQILLFGSLLLVLAGGIIALTPFWHAGKGKKKHDAPVANLLIGVVLIVASLGLVYAFGEETYRCDILLEENCD